ncbi:MAG: ankyrin repeat domain-containing protein, partial [Desulfomonilaceae bacterium]|nr:ankyrin repeat domain-containing protein [Desulfomonilaceae bacterium]
MRKAAVRAAAGSLRHSGRIASLRPSLAVPIVVLTIAMLCIPSHASADKKTAEGIRSTLQTGDLHALVVGVSKFRDERIPKLNLAAVDAKAFGEFLETQDQVFKKILVTYLIDVNATKSEIEKHLYYTLPKAGKDDTIILFFSGHGTYDPMRPKDFLFLAYDSEPDYVGTTAVKMSGLDFLKGIEADRVLIIADACHAGGFSEMKPKGTSPSLDLFVQEVRNSSGKAIITSGKGDQLSWEIPGLKHSVFTHNLLEGLKGGADRDRDGVVTLNEVYGYAYGRTKEETEGHQHPQFEGKVVGAFPLSHVGPPVPESKVKEMFLDAVRKGNVKKVEELIHVTGSVNARNHHNDTPLIVASRNGNLHVLKLLLAKSADHAATNNAGDTALISAAAYGHVEAVEMLLEAGTQVDVKNRNGVSPLAAACRRGHTDSARLLIRNGANTRSRTNSGATPLMSAASQGNASLVELLLVSGADPESADLAGNTPLSLAARRGHTEPVKLLLEKGARMTVRGGGTQEDQLILGVLRAHPGRVKEALSKGANVNAVTTTGDCPLSIAVGMGDMKILKLLISHGAAVNAVPENALPAVTAAAEYGKPEALHVLLDRGAHPDATDGRGNTALMAAARNGRIEAARILLGKGVDFNRKNTKGLTPLMHAAKNNQWRAVQLLLEHGADPDLRDLGGSTALMMSAREGHLESLRVLVGVRCNLDAQDEKGRTALI